MKKALLVDTNISSLPLFEALQTSYDVACIGNNPNDYMPRYGVKYYNINYNNLTDFKKFLQKQKFSAIIPGCNDVSYEACASLLNPLLKNRIDPIEIISQLHNKKKFRELSLKLEISVPKVFHDLNDIEYPIIVKPTDSFSGKGVEVLTQNSKVQLMRAITSSCAHSRTSTYLIEEFISGQLYSHSCFIRNGKIEEEFFVEEFSTANPYVVDLSRVKTDIKLKVKEKIKVDLSKIINHLNLRDGLIHTQFIERDNVPYIIEITRRCPGDLYSLLIEKATGFEYAKKYVKIFADIINSRQKKISNNFIVRYTITSPAKYEFRSIRSQDDWNLNEVFSLEKSGQQLPGSPNGRAAILFFSPTTRMAQKKLINLLKTRNRLPMSTKEMI